MPFNFTPFPLLKTERLVLRELRPSDVPTLLALRNSEGTREHSRRPPRTEQEMVDMVARVANEVQNNIAIGWGVTLHDSDELIGDIAFWRMKPEHFRAEIGYTFAQEHWGKGLASEAVRAVLDYGFEKMGLHSVEACINPENTRSARLLEKHGFMREAYFVENEFYNGKFLDMAIYSLLAPKEGTN